MEKYFEILEEIRKANLDETKLYLLSCLDLSDKALAVMQMEYCYNLWLYADVDLCLSRLAEEVSYYWQEIQNNKIFGEDIINKCLDI